jgi:uncharacterized protein YyaL (SSP411 family)
MEIYLKNPPSLKHLSNLTTQIGLYQHCRFDEPDKKFGYSIDDNARAIIAVYEYHKIYHDPKVLDLAKVYLRYIERAQLSSGYFHNFANSRGKFIDVKGSQDSNGRVIWTLGYILANNEVSPELTKKAQKILSKIPKNLRGLRYNRAKAFALLGYYYLQDKQEVKKISAYLLKSYKLKSSQDWHWFENEITYSNAILPYSLLLTYELLNQEKYKEIALESLAFLRNKCLVNGIPAPVGQKGWLFKGKRKAIYDQQVVDATDMVFAFITAWRATKEKKYLERAKGWWMWFHGNNLKEKVMIDPSTGGCFDGLTKEGINLNQGAESIVCYLMAHMMMAAASQEAQMEEK